MSDTYEMGAALTALEKEIPILSVLSQFAATAGDLPWFARLGEPLAVKTKHLARAYLDGLGFPEAEMAAVLNWDDAASAAEALDTNSAAWEAEEQLRAAATQDALGGLSEDALSIAASDLAARLADPLDSCAEEAITMGDANIEALHTLAVGSGQHAAHGALLALAAAASTAAQSDAEIDAAQLARAPLMLKYQIFATGHWPLALSGQTLNLF